MKFLTIASVCMITLAASSCGVPPERYEELEASYYELMTERDDLQQECEELRAKVEAYESAVSNIENYTSDVSGGCPSCGDEVRCRSCGEDIQSYIGNIEMSVSDATSIY